MQEAPTIAAISTPWGRGGIAVIRISGPDACAVGDRMFRPHAGEPLSARSGNTTVYGSICYEGEIIDDGIAALFRAPHSFTGDDTVELSCHGGILLAEKVLESALLCGAEAAGPGAFSKRAFENGKLSLTEAESVIDLINAESMQAVRLAGSGARGTLHRAVDALCDTLRHLLASTYVFIDFPDEDLSEVTGEEMLAQAEVLAEKLTKLKQTFHTGRAVLHGIETAIVGKPNTGKSSLLNQLLGCDRAIVTPVAGTTRDVLTETAVLGHVTLRLCDTAGIRESDDPVERLGVARSLEALKTCELALVVFDASRALDEDDRRILAAVQSHDAVAVCVWNKTDLSAADPPASLASHFRAVVPVSAQTGDGMDALRETVEGLYIDGTINLAEDAVLANTRQHAAVSKALDAVLRARDALRAGYTQDIAGMDLELALRTLGEIDARTVSEEVTDAIFHQFCVGK